MENNAVVDGFKPRGIVEIFVSKKAPKINPGKVLSESSGIKIFEGCELDFSECELLDKIKIENIVVNVGKDQIIKALVTGNINKIGRMAIGDRGTIPSDPSTPKVPTSDFTALYNEVYRADCDTAVLNVGGIVHEVKFIKSFNAVDIPITAFSNQSNPVVNEVGLITYDTNSVTGPLPRPPVEAPNTPPADEGLFSIRTFKSVPFDAANEISITIRYTVFID